MGRANGPGHIIRRTHSRIEIGVIFPITKHCETYGAYEGDTACGGFNKGRSDTLKFLGHAILGQLVEWVNVRGTCRQLGECHQEKAKAARFASSFRSS